MGSVNERSGKNDKRLRKELAAILMSKYDRTGFGNDSWETRSGIADGLADLVRRRELSEIVDALELCGVLSCTEALRFREAKQKPQVIEEAAGLLQPLGTLPVRRKVDIFRRQMFGVATWANAWDSHTARLR